MRVGLTATSRGATRPQLDTLRQTFLDLGVRELHHGDCVGGDAQAHLVARSLWGIRIVGHPPEIERFRAFCEFDETRPLFPYLERNRHIVDETEMLIAMPAGREEELRSGTWSTIRYARRLRRRVIIILPTGETTEERAGTPARPGASRPLRAVPGRF